MTHLLLAHAAILYVARLSNKTAINRTVHAAHAHISFDVSGTNDSYTLLLRLWTPGITNPLWTQWRKGKLHSNADVKL